MEDNSRYYQSRRFRKLLQQYEDAVAQGHVPYMEADELTDIAEYYMTGKQDAKASEAIRVAIDMHPDSVDPQVFLARQKMFYGDLAGARSIVDAITEQEDTEVIYLNAELSIKEGHVQEASAYLLRQMHMQQDSLDVYLYDCTAIFMDYDQWEMAESWAQRLKDAYPNHPRLPLMEAEISMGLDAYEQAQPMLQEILDREPYNSEAWNLLAETDIALEKYEEAIEAADFSLAINPDDANATLMKANAYLRCDEMEEAAGLYTRYLERQSDDLTAQISLAICLNSTERYAEALELLTRAEADLGKQTGAQYDYSQVYLMRAYSLSRLERLDESLACMEQARPYFDEGAAWQFNMALADIYLHAGMAGEAESHFAQALSNAPDKPETLFNIALAYAGAEYYDAAIDLLDDVWTICGTQEGKFVVPHLAKCHLMKGNMEEYLKYLQIAPSCDREATLHLFRDRYPGIQPEDYYHYAYRDVYGHFPEPPAAPNLK